MQVKVRRYPLPTWLRDMKQHILTQHINICSQYNLTKMWNSSNFQGDQRPLTPKTLNPPTPPQINPQEKPPSTDQMNPLRAHCILP